LLRREIGERLFHVINEEGFDMSAVTITQVITSRNLKNARVMVSIRDHHQERGKMLGLLARHRRELQSHINKTLGMKFTPRLAFELDTSLEKGNHILDLLTKIEQAETAAPTSPPDEEPTEDPGV
jgi:ribosome-binding factor A